MLTWIAAIAATAIRETAKIGFVIFVVGSMSAARFFGRQQVSALQFRQLVFDFLPLVCIGRGGLAFDDRLPHLGQFGVECRKLLLVGRHVVLGEDRVHRALRDAQRTIDAFVGI